MSERWEEQRRGETERGKGLRKTEENKADWKKERQTQRK